MTRGVTVVAPSVRSATKHRNGGVGDEEKKLRVKKRCSR